jgi:hypothetical protein
VLLNKCYGGENIEENETAGRSVRMGDTIYICSISVYAQKLDIAQTAGIFIYPVIAEKDFSCIHELK